MPEKEEWLTVAEVADTLRVKPLTIRRAILKGKLKASKIGGRTGYRISPDAVQDYMREISKRPAA